MCLCVSGARPGWDYEHFTGTGKLARRARARHGHGASARALALGARAMPGLDLELSAGRLLVPKPGKLRLRSLPVALAGHWRVMVRSESAPGRLTPSRPAAAPDRRNLECST